MAAKTTSAAPAKKAAAKPTPAKRAAARVAEEPISVESPAMPLVITVRCGSSSERGCPVRGERQQITLQPLVPGVVAYPSLRCEHCFGEMWVVAVGRGEDGSPVDYWNQEEPDGTFA